MEPLLEAATLPNLRSPECLARGLPQGGKPTKRSVRRRTVRRARGRKNERISESKLHGTVNYNLVALLTRGSASSRVVGPSLRVVHGDRKSRRSYEQGPSWTSVEPSELGHVVRRSAAVTATEAPTHSTVQGECTGVGRTIKDSGPSQGSG